MNAPSQQTKNLAPFFERSYFAEDATFTPQEGNKVSLKVIFNSEFSMQEELAIRYDGSRPTAMCREDAVGEPKIGDKLEVRDTEFWVVGVEPSGTGTVVLVLSRDEPK